MPRFRLRCLRVFYRFLLLACFLPACALFSLSNSLSAQTLPQANAHIGFLDKITGRFQDKTIQINTDTTFGTLLVKVRACYRSAPGDKNESAAFLEIIDIREKTTTKVFSGWMFATTPSLSSMEHIVYDIWLISCPKDQDKVSTNLPFFRNA